MHIGVDAWNLPHDRRGIGRYVRQILRCWQARSDPPTITLVIPERFTAFAAHRYRYEIGGERLAVRSRDDARRLRLDVLWFPWNGISWSAPGVKVATLHDASVFAMPVSDRETAAREQRIFVDAAREAARVITDSFFSKVELVRHLGIDAERVDVVHLAVDASLVRQARASKRPAWLGSNPYLLFVGVPEPRKGLDVLVESMKRLPAQTRAATTLVVAGAISEATKIPDAGELDIRYRGHVDDSELAALYAHAAMLVYPSSYEGFGLPVVEAMACGAPVVASDAPGVAEAASGAALLVPSQDAGALSTAIVSLLNDTAKAERLRAAGFARAATTTWEKTAEETLAVLATVVSRL